MAKSARIRSAVDGGDRHAGSVEFFPLSLQSVQPWNGDWERHADLFAEYLRDARIGSAVLIHGAIAGVATMLEIALDQHRACAVGGSDGPCPAMAPSRGRARTANHF